MEHEIFPQNELDEAVLLRSKSFFYHGTFESN